MRSIAVLVAALLAMVVKSITAEEADAAAAVIVSFVIMLTVRGICANIVELWHIRQEEQADLVLSSSQTLQQKA